MAASDYLKLQIKKINNLINNCHNIMDKKERETRTEKKRCPCSEQKKF